MLKRFEWLSNLILPWAVMVYIAVEILLPKLPVASIHGTSVKIRYDDFSLIVLVVIWGLGFWWLKKRFFTNLSNLSIFFFWIVGFVSLISALYLTQTATRNLAILNWARRIEYMLLFFVGVTAARDQKNVIKYLLVMLTAGLVSIGYALGQVYLHWCSISTTNSEFSKGQCIPLTTGARPNSTFGNQAEFSIFLGFVIPFIICLFFAANKLWQKVVLAIMFCAYFGMIILTQARWPFVAAAVTIVAMLWLYNQKKLLAAFIVVGALGIVVAGHSLLIRYTTTIQQFLHPVKQQQVQQIPIQQLIYETTTAGGRKTYSASAIPGQENLPDENQYKKLHPQEYLKVADPALEAQRSTSIRTNEEWPRAIRAFERNPLLGSGYSSIDIATDNDYLRSLGEVGLFGTIAFAFIFVVMFKTIYRYLYKPSGRTKLTRSLAIGFCAAVLGFFVNAVFIDVFEASKLGTLFWLLAGIFMAVMAQTLRPKEYKD